MNDHLRAQSRARLATIETRLLELERHLEAGREREAIEELCDLRAQINDLFVSLLVGHLHEMASQSSSSQTKEEQNEQLNALFRQLLNIA